MEQRYLIRLDDACPTMDAAKWKRLEDILDKYGVKPMVGVIPHNEDTMQQIDPTDDNFWGKVKNWEAKGWAIALHGYNHCYDSNSGLKGFNPMWSRSEFAGIPLDVQKERIRKGMKIMTEHNLNPKYFFAPSHTFDENTLIALREESNIRIISDTIATRPYRYKDFIMIPQFGGQCREMKLSGLFTFCLHPNTMKDEAFEKTDKFLKTYREMFTSFEKLDLSNVTKKSLSNRLLSWGYFTYRRIRKIR